MQIFSTKLTMNMLGNIANTMGIKLYEEQDEGIRQRGKYAGRHAFKLLLRPGPNDRWRKANIDLSGKLRRAWAVSWAGHYVFMRALLELDPEAIIKTSARTSYNGEWGIEYHGVLDFNLYAWETGSANIGSMVQPQSFRDAEAENHIEWDGKASLVIMAMNVVRLLDDGETATSRELTVRA